MRLLIDNERRTVYPLPWDNDSTSFSFKKPTRILSPNSTISKPEKVETLVVGCNLPDYGFIGSMVNLTQLYIYYGANINELSFLRNLTKLTQLCILESHVRTLDDLVGLINLKYSLYKTFTEEQELIGRLTYAFEGVCIMTDNYKGDGRELIHSSICRSEILVNNNRIGHEEMYENPEYRKFLEKEHFYEIL